MSDEIDKLNEIHIPTLTEVISDKKMSMSLKSLLQNQSQRKADFLQVKR